MRAIRNVHERVIEAPAAAVTPLLDRLSAADDPIWPGPAWEPMRFDRPLGVGATGGHGPIRYRVAAYEPGRLRFDFAPPWVGHHELTVEELDAARCRVRHTVVGESLGAARLVWPFAIRPVHDTMVEELLDNIERIATGAVAAPARWSPWVRLLNRCYWPRPEAVQIPRSARLIRAAVDRPGYRDAYRMELRPGLPRDPAAWTGVLRDAFPVLDRTDDELLLDVNVAGLTARACLHVDDQHVTLATAVRADTARARLYWAAVRLAHPLMARAMLRRTHRRLALAAPPAGERARTSGARLT